MLIIIIFPAESGEIITIGFTKNTALDHVKYGTWNTQSNEVELCTEAWEFMQAQRKNIRKLKPMMDRLEKFIPVALPATD